MHRILNKVEDYRKHSQKNVRMLMEFFEFITILSLLPASFFILETYVVSAIHFDIGQYSIFAALVIISWYVLSRISVMSKIPRTQRYLQLMFQMIRINFIFMLILIAFKYIFFLKSIPLIFIFTFVSLTLLMTISMRLFAFKILKTYRANGYNLHRVLIIADAFSDGTIESLIDQKDWGFMVNGIITKSRLIRAKYGKSIAIYQNTHELKSIIDNTVIDEVLYCRKEIDEEEIKSIVSLCDEVGVIFRLQSSVSPLDPMEMQMKTLNSSGYLSLVDIPSNRASMIIKTMGDFYFSITALILLAPVFLVIALLIRLDSPGPVFFKQERIGLRGRKFKLYKFRTMITDAEKILEKLKAQNEMDGPTFKMKNDPRITPIGRFLRKTGLDELPQLYNVVRGEMSLIGPRPPLEQEVKQYKRWQLRRLSVKPGITCTWQIVPDRNDIKFEKWMHMDLHYIDNWSLTEDIKLFFRTISSFFMPSGR